MVPFEKKKTNTTQWDTYLEIQIAVVDMQKKEDEKGENAKIKKSQDRCLEMDYISSSQGCSIKLNQMNLDLKCISETIINRFMYTQSEFKWPQFALVQFTLK